MGRFPQKSRDSKGSLRNIQLLTNLYPDLINGQLKQRFPELQEETIEWKSPVESDDYAEYRDGAFIELMKLKQDEIKLEEFWPSYGPQWDALALTNKGSVILVEAKANLPEIISSSSGAKSVPSQLLIRKSLEETKAYLEFKNDIDWSGKYYQYANRLAHLYYLRVKRGIPAFLLNIYFVGDISVNGPKSEQEWHVAIQELNTHLGLTQHKLSSYIAQLFIDVNDFR